MSPKPSHDALIHCEHCGEDYSATYRRCPFCGERNDPRRVTPRNDPTSSSRYVPMPPAAKPAASSRNNEEELDDGYVFDGQDAFDEEPEEEYYAPRPKGGKRLAPKQPGRFDPPPVNWPRLITFLCSLIIIVAALVIVFTFIYPQLHGNQDPNAEVSAPASVEPTMPPIITPTPGVTQPSEPVDPVEPSQTVPDPVEPVLSGIVLKNSDGRVVDDITLTVGRSAQLTAEFTPSSWTGPVTWSSSNPEWVTVTDSGYVTNVNQSGAFHNVYLTVSAGGISTQCIVRATAGENPVHTPAPSASQPPADNSQPPSGGGALTAGSRGTIVGADGGLRVRSGPGTSYEVAASLKNGDSVTIVAPAENGWYQINFAGSGGATMTGYIMGEYISPN